MPDTQTTTRPIQMTMARETDENIERVWGFYHELMEQLDECPQDDKLGEWLVFNHERLTDHLQRILFGYQALVDSVCDKTLDHLDFKPEIKRAFAQAELVPQLVKAVYRLCWCRTDEGDCAACDLRMENGHCGAANVLGSEVAQEVLKEEGAPCTP